MVEEAYATCLQIARGHYENFPVASWLVPGRLRPHVAAIYAFARHADDIADEPGLVDAERLRQLDEWGNQLHQPPRTPIFEALHDTRQRFNLPIEPFEQLLSAFRQDVVQTRYETWEQVLDYCRRSANPVGRLVLGLAGVSGADAHASSDALCTALQLTNFWQDLAIDWERGRLYVPTSVWAAEGALLDDLNRRTFSPAWQRSLSACDTVTRALFADGGRVCDALSGRLRYELRATWHGGRRVLDRLQRRHYDVFAERPTLTTADLLVVGWRSLTWRAIPRSITPS